ncbi:hypothetical protein [Pseudomonas urmiensis]|uniref:DUF2256 domain-containing protein n=1 Tax=Pseudomonas urmiensis TaxID=2745493 RepID=A0A923JVV4_9PSED|nr:hypothetical protein [Pseudomonas urmiensis]MBV4536900.1 hypothetical protein [Pseudomonas urmiensis]
MASTVQVACQWCRKAFTARTADRKRGWARFCSKSCKASKQEKRTGQNAAFHERRVGSGNGFFDDDDVMSEISDMDFGASDGGGYESIR